MNQFGPFVTLLGLAAVALTGLGALASRWNKEEQRLRRGLRKVLGEDPHALIIAPGRGRGAGFNFTSNTMAVAWDVGGWCLVYRIDELMGAELLIDGQVVARVWRGEARRALESMGDAEKQVALRLVFDDPRYPDFSLELWSPSRPGGPDAAAEEGNRWIARTESLFRRAPSPAATPRPHQEPMVELRPPPSPEPEAPGKPAAADRQELPFSAAPPWEDEEEASIEDDADGEFRP